ncbi:Arc/MetJ-type ribon-helix-helix transcriptional regulator [Tenggerimyces flavus]|nr:Arc/MetJ-type ribon-helix-helix transcriptional regulator [Tenggerimyces flavus]
MISAMTTRIAVRLPAELVHDAREAVRTGQVASVSAYIADAMIAWKRERALAGLVADFKSEFGGPSAEDYAWADEVLATSTHRSEARSVHRLST